MRAKQGRQRASSAAYLVDFGVDDGAGRQSLLDYIRVDSFAYILIGRLYKGSLYKGRFHWVDFIRVDSIRVDSIRVDSISVYSNR